MIKVVNIESKNRMPVAEGREELLSHLTMGPEFGSRSRTLISGKTFRLAPSDKTQVVYILEGKDARSDLHNGWESVRTHGPATGGRLSGTAGGSHGHRFGNSAVLVLVRCPSTPARHRPRMPAGYFFERHDSIAIDEKRFRERTFWVNKETGLSGSWDLQLGRMLYARMRILRGTSIIGRRPVPLQPDHFYFIEKAPVK